VRAALMKFNVGTRPLRSVLTFAYELRECLAKRDEHLQAELAGRLAESEPPRSRTCSTFAVESLPLWAQDILLHPQQVASCASIWTSDGPLLEGARGDWPFGAVSAQVRDWAWATGVNTFGLQHYLRKQARSGNGTRRSPLTVARPTDEQVLDCALSMLPQWGQELRFGPPISKPCEVI